MDMTFKQMFLDRWNHFFPGVELPICFYYTDDAGLVDKAPPTSEWRCFIADLAKVRKGKPVAFGAEAVTCSGGQRYLGFSQELRPDFEYFLSCGIEGRLEGERYKKTPELVNEFMKRVPPFEAPGKFIVFKRFDVLEKTDEPQVTIFFVSPDAMAGLFTLAGFDSAASEAVAAPFGSGCSSIVFLPYCQLQESQPKPIIGMFDISARPYVASDILTFAAPWPKFVSMVHDMEESFLITASWDKVRKRLGEGNDPQGGSRSDENSIL
ncbi:MAG: DUF169 domain-containing protein [candidate division Zixibacteria bacterium]|nr:DUF169 domain-containing protein [candidate division Zixibacteria bacterium]